MAARLLTGEEMFNIAFLKKRLGDELDRAIEEGEDGWYVNPLLAADVALALKIEEQQKLKKERVDGVLSN